MLWIAIFAGLLFVGVAARLKAARTGWFAAFAGLVVVVLATRLGAQALWALLPTLAWFASRWLPAKAQSERFESASSPPRARRPMDHEEALRVLGLRAGASRAEIASAHRSLIKKVHPDQGGSDLLAQQVNEAKRVLESSAPV